MDNRSLDKAMEIYAKLIVGEEVGSRVNVDLYEAWRTNAEVYDILDTILKKSNLHLYEYSNGLYITAGEKNRVFGFTNDELKKAIGLRLNKELFLAYFVIYHIVTIFYKDSGDYSSQDYVKIEEVIGHVTSSIQGIMKRLDIISVNETEENSLKSVAFLWEELPLMANNDDAMTLKAARGSKIGMVKLIFNFLITQDLFVENGDKYYATDRFRALAENYYSENRGRLYEIVMEGGEVSDAAHEPDPSE